VASAPIRLSRAILGDDARFRLHGWLTLRRLTTLPYGRIRPKIGRSMVRADTDIVIEGFPRSANTYAVAAFRCANGTGPVVASHLHAASSVEGGVRRRIPVIVVIRDPLDACVSLIQRQSLRPSSALEAYIRFHTGIRPYLEDIVVSEFSVTTEAFGSTIETTNRRFGTAFVPYERTEANEAWCRSFVIEADRKDQGEVRESTVAVPQTVRQSSRQPVVDAVNQEVSLLAESRRLYDDVRSTAVRRGDR
jgi:hypothetical protein